MNPIFLAIYILSATIFALAHGYERFGWKRMLLLLALTIGISLLFESAGVASGVIFGSYQYTDDLGSMFLGQVPYIIPVAWFMMIYPSLIVALRIVPTRRKRRIWVLLVAAVGGLAMTAWDLALDPVMVSLGFWEWHDGGPYFGVPVWNLIGWFLTSFIILALFLWFGRLLKPALYQERTSFDRLPVVIYAITGISTVLVAQNSDLGGPALVGLLAMLPLVVLGWRGTYG